MAQVKPIQTKFNTKNTTMYLYCIFTSFSSPLFNLNKRTPSINMKVRMKVEIINDHPSTSITTGSNPVAIDGARFDLMRCNNSIESTSAKPTLPTYKIGNRLTINPMTAVRDGAKSIFDGCLIQDRKSTRLNSSHVAIS